MRARYIFPLVSALFLPLLLPTASLAHDDRHLDPNDAKGRFDIARVETTHRKDRVLFEITLHGRFHATDVSAKASRYFFIGLDLDQREGDNSIFERCVFIVSPRGLQAIATDCAAHRYDMRDASGRAPSSVVTGLDLRRMQVRGSYRFAVLSYWGSKSCRNNLCVDAAPNRLPLYLEDRTRPLVEMFPPPPITEPSIEVPFALRDPSGSGVTHWVMQKQRNGDTDWEIVATGTEGGSISAAITPGGGIWDVRVIATDAHGNKGIGRPWPISVPFDDLELTPFATFVGPNSSVPSDGVFGSGFLSLDAVGSSVTYDFDFTRPNSCYLVEAHGPGSGDWEISLTLDGASSTVTAADLPDSEDELLFSYFICTGRAHQIAIQLTSGSGFGLDYVSGVGGLVAA